MTDLYKIKPLDWQLDEDGDWAAGGYYIRHFNTGLWGWAEMPHSVSAMATTLDEAKAAVEADRLLHLLQHLDPVPEAPQWQPIETAPKDGWHAPLLTCRMGDPESGFGGEPVGGYAEPPEAAYWNEHGDCWTPCQRPHDKWEPTHWSPLPAAPALAQVEKADG